MTRFIRGSLPADVACITLTITGSHGKYLWTYTNSTLILNELVNSVQIALNDQTTDKGFSEITQYSSTGVTAEYSPITNFKVVDGGKSAGMTITLNSNQLIDFGVFVRLTNNKQEVETIFCDPQASNDPIKYC